MPICGVSKKGSKVSHLSKLVINAFFEYETIEELKEILNLIIKEIDSLEFKRKKQKSDIKLP